MIKALVEVTAYIQDFLDNRLSFDDAWDMSYELPHLISVYIEDIEKYSAPAAKLLNDDIIDWCAALDSSDEDDWPDVISEKTFRKKLAEALEKLKAF